MKKVILTIVITLLIFQMVVLAIAIDVGSAAIDRSDTLSTGWTVVVKDNPANASGKITTVAVYVRSTSLVDAEVATFYVVSGDNLSTRDTEVIGNVSTGYHEISVDLDVQAGDYIGIYYPTSSGVARALSGSAGLWAINSDQIPCTNVTFSVWAGDTLSLYGTGTTAEEENVIFFGINL